LKNGSTTEKGYINGSQVQDVSLEKQDFQFLYKDAENAVFMNKSTYEQVEIPHQVIQSDLPYIKEGDDVNVLFWEENPLSVDIPPRVKLKVSETAPGVKGNSATNIFKSAKLENELSAKVPLFIEEGDYVVIDTRTGEYVERGK